jgi:hypothetical protein
MPKFTAVVTFLILERALCPDCLAAKAGATPAEIDGVVSRLSRVLRLHHPAVQPCGGCGQIGQVVSLDRPSP